MYRIFNSWPLLLLFLLAACRPEALPVAAISTPLPSAEAGKETVVAPVPTSVPDPTAVPVATALPAPDVEPATEEQPQAATTLPVDRMFLGAYDLEDQLNDRQLDVEMDYFDWVKYDAIGTFIYRTVEQGRIPVVSLEPWTTTSGRLENVLHDTGAGLNDEIVRNVAKTIKASTQQQVLVRWAQEPELTGLYPWSLQDPAPYIDSFQRMHRIFGEEGVTNAVWVWSPAGNGNAMDYYPGGEYVDLVGITVLENRDWNLKNGLKESTSFDELFGEKYRTVAAAGKPVIIAELGVSGPREFQDTWLDAAFAAMPGYPALHGVIYFDAINAPNGWSGDRPDWRIDPAALPDPADMPLLAMNNEQ